MTDADDERTYQRKLAGLVIRTLDQQQKYFRTRSPADLTESKTLEKILRTEANAVLNPPQPQKQGTML